MLLLCSHRSVLLNSPCRGQDARGPHPSPGLRYGVSHTHCSHQEDVAQQACSSGNYDAGCRVRTSGLKGAVALINFFTVEIVIVGKLPFSSWDKISLRDTTLSPLLEKTKLVQFNYAKVLFKTPAFYFIHTGSDFKYSSYSALFPCIQKKENIRKTNWLRRSLRCLPLRGQIPLSLSVTHVVWLGYEELMVQPKGDGDA